MTDTSSSDNWSVDFRSHLAVQLDFITASCDRYDHGHFREAVRIATALRVIFHRSRSSSPLIAHLGEHNPNLLSTCDVARRGQEFFPAMTVLVIHSAAGPCEFAPKVRVPYERFVHFNKWWFQEVVYLHDAKGLRLTRKDIVTDAANQDGGAHVDARLAPRYEQLLAGLDWSMTYTPDDGQPRHIPCANGSYAALRQIGYEVLHSPELASLAT